MHPIGRFLALLDPGPSETDEHRPRSDEPLPPIDDATLRAWRTWGRRVGMIDRPALDRRATQPAPSPGQPADRPA